MELKWALPSLKHPISPSSVLGLSSHTCKITFSTRVNVGSTEVLCHPVIGSLPSCLLSQILYLSTSFSNGNNTEKEFSHTMGNCLVTLQDNLVYFLGPLALWAWLNHRDPYTWVSSKPIDFTATQQKRLWAIVSQVPHKNLPSTLSCLNLCILRLKGVMSLLINRNSTPSLHGTSKQKTFVLLSSLPFFQSSKYRAWKLSREDRKLLSHSVFVIL